jgi:hypothetical protein
MAAVTDGHTLLAPNTELAAALFDAVERIHQETGRDVWPTPACAISAVGCGNSILRGN